MATQEESGGLLICRRGVLSFLVPLLLLALLAFPPFFLFRIEAPKETEGTGKGKTEGVVFLHPAAEGRELAPYEKNLYESIRVQEPAEFLNPNAEKGFAHGVESLAPSPRTKLKETPVPELALGPEKATYGDGPALQEGGSVTSRNKVVLHELWLPLEKKEGSSCPKGVFWYDGGGRQWLNAPQVHGSAPRPTVLELLSGVRIPRVLLRGSCGDPQLDERALSALRERVSRYADYSGEGAGEFPSLVLEVHWNE